MGFSQASCAARSARGRGIYLKHETPVWLEITAFWFASIVSSAKECRCLLKTLSGMTRVWAYGSEAAHGRVSEPAAAYYPVAIHAASATGVRLWNIDRLLLVWLYRLYPSLLDAIVIVQLETVLRWHRRGSPRLLALEVLPRRRPSTD
jgi:hypothetical protein